jgi:uncharacterized tellurite resistance protein B-like protein
MIDKLLALLTGSEAPHIENKGSDLEAAVAALLIEAARMDSSFDAAERTAIERLLADRFALEPERVRALVAATETTVAHTAQYYPFTREICVRLSREERIEILEMLWNVAYADGRIDPYEDALLRQIAGLIHVPDRERGLARQRALAKLKPEDG